MSIYFVEIYLWTSFIILIFAPIVLGFFVFIFRNIAKYIS